MSDFFTQEINETTGNNDNNTSILQDSTHPNNATMISLPNVENEDNVDLDAFNNYESKEQEPSVLRCVFFLIKFLLYFLERSNSATKTFSIFCGNFSGMFKCLVCCYL